MKFIRIHPHDQVAVAITDLPAGERLMVGALSVTTREKIPSGHKIALHPIPQGGLVLKYGYPIGRATTDIAVGDWIHTHNLRTTLEGLLEYAYAPLPCALPPIADGLTFAGFVRANGDVGIRNEIWIVPTVGCVNKLAETLAHQMNAELPPDSAVSGVYAWTHPYGCSQMGADLRRTQQTLAGLVQHPNAGGVLVLGLGCEYNHVTAFQEFVGEYDPDRVRFLVAQECVDEQAAGMQALRQLVANASRCTREPVPLARLKVGLKCGGSDGFSGITANPLVGAFSDLLVARGGTTALTEVPEMFGAETLLLNRCRNEAVFDKCVRMVNDFKAYLLEHQLPIYENPAPGNKAGGITTLEDKSLGCVQKGGSSPITDVITYGERLQTPGLNLLDGPSNDGVSMTGLTAAGVHLIVFTTGRGTPLGTAVPTVKIATNPPLAARKPHWIDFDAGRLLTGATLPDLAQELLHCVIAVASGQQTRNEQHGYREIAIFKDSVTL